MLCNQPYFTIFGGSYIPDCHARTHARTQGFRLERKAGDGPSWLVFCALIGGIGIIAAEIATSVLL